jgi:hypothetical protein
VRIPLATSIQSEDGTLDRGGRIQNGLVEAVGESSVVRKRPGLAIGSLIRVGTAQLAYWWSGLLNTVIGDVFSQGTVPTLATTLNPSDKGAAVSLSGGDLIATSATNNAVRSIGSISTGSVYYEVTVGGAATGGWYVGIGNSSATLTGDPVGVGSVTFGYTATIFAQGVSQGTFGAAITVGQVIGVLANRTAGTVSFYVNGTLRGTMSGANVQSGAMYAYVGFVVSGFGAAILTTNFGATPFAYPITASQTTLSPTNAGLQFTAQDSGSNAASSLLMIKNASQAWTVTPAGVVSQITDVDYPGTYTVTATSLTRVGTVATVTTPTDTNFQVGSTVTIAGATPSAYNGAQTVTGVTPSTSVPNSSVQITITRSGTTATATTVSQPHSFKTGDVVPISGASQSQYNGNFAITWISPTQFSFTVTTSDSSQTTPTAASVASPATGSPIISTFLGGYGFQMVNTIGSPTVFTGESIRFFNSGASYTGQPIAVGTVFTFNPSAAAVANFGSLGPFTVSSVSGGGVGFTFTAAGGVFPMPSPGPGGKFDAPFSINRPTISSITSANGVATVTTSSDHFYQTGAQVTIAGATPTAYNGTFAITVTGATTFTYNLGGGTTTTIVTNPVTPATGTIFAGSPGSATGASFTFSIAGSPTTPATGTITVSGGRNTVPGIAYLNGYFCVMDVNGVIYNSAEDNPASWTALEYVTAQAENGAGKAIAKSLNYLVAFKERSTEFFYDAKNEPPGSPFSPVDNGFTQIGCASGDSLCEVDGALMWVAQARQQGRSVYVMRGTDQQKVSTADVERILNRSTLASVFAYGLKVDGHTLYVLTLVDLDITLVYDAQSQTWVQWSTLTAGSSKSVSSITRVGTTATVTTSTDHTLNDGDAVTIAGAVQSDYNGTFQIRYVSSTVFTIEVANSPVTPATGTITAVPYTESYFKLTKYANAGGTNTFLHESNGYTSTMSSSVYQDNSAPVSFTMRTARLDGGSLKSKQLGQLCLVGEKTGDTVMVRFSDDDYTTNSIYRAVSLNTERPALRRLGAFRRRSFEVKHIGNTAPRLEAMEIGQ